jgi:hypothetical protein
VKSRASYTSDDYLNSTLFDVHKWSEYPEVLAVRKHILNELGFKGSKKEINHVTVVLLNLYYTYCLDPDMWVMFSRDRNDYNQGKRYNKLFIKYENMIKTVDGLLALGYIEQAKGFKDRVTNKSFDSRMKATNKLIDVIKKKHAVKFEMIGKYAPDELVVLRDAAGEEIDYDDTKETKAMQDLLVRYNKLLDETYIDIHFDVSDIRDRIDACRNKIDKKTRNPKEYRLVINLSNKRVRRIFNKSTFSQGGRFYGGWWQSIPSKLRERIIMNRDYTVEIDYSGLHIYLLYAQKGINFADLNKEPYIYPKDNDPLNLRPILKTLLLAAVNSKNEVECIMAVQSEINKNKEAYPDEIPDLKETYKKFKEYHSDIADMFCSKSGLKLQRIDSTIAEAVVKVMTKENIPILVVHDSFVCSKKEEDYLYEVMIKAFHLYASKLNISTKNNDSFSSNPIGTKTKDITLRQPEIIREEDILIDYLSWGDKPQARRFTNYLLTEDPTTNVVIKVKNENITEVGLEICEPVFNVDDFSMETS